MFVKKISETEKEAARKKMQEVFGECREVTDKPLRPFLLKWLSAFAPDMEFYDAKAFCLPRRMYQNNIWHAFSYQKTDCYMGALANEAFSGGFPGMCYVLLNRELMLFQIPDGSILTPEMVSAFDNIVITDRAFSCTYVYTGKEDMGPYFKTAEGATDAFVAAGEDEPEPEEEGFSVPPVDEDDASPLM
ncbi:MAG: DUF4275 family protein [Clostridiales bacterium]|nr:DUF4275 family protein [Clostridiales bacterium]